MNLTLRNNILVILLGLIAVPSFGQEVLEKTDAITIALENNFDIRTADNNVAIARNNADVKNSGYLPSLSANGAATMSISDTETTLQDGTIRAVDGVDTYRYSASIGLNYTLFDGFGREYLFKSLKENYNISELQARFVIENSLISIFSGYYEVAKLTENELTQKQSLDISRERLQRAKYGFEYGQSTQLDVLNAEVDYNTDSINYLTIRQQLENEKRNLNLLLGRDVEIEYLVDTTLSYVSGLSLEDLMEKSKANNVNVLLSQGNLLNAEYNIKSISAARIPKLGLNANYGANLNELGPTSFADRQVLIGPSIGATLSWNIFDGGSTNIRRQNSKINLENQQVALEQTQLDLSRNVNNAWNIYKTALFVMEAERTNLRTNQRNFDRTVEQYGLGQITSIVFRQAQINLINAQLNYNSAKYAAKIAELALYQLSGDLMDAEF